MDLNDDIDSDEKVQQVTGQIILNQTFLVAYQIGLFDLLSKYHNLSLKKISGLLNLSDRASLAMLSTACTLGFIEYNKDLYQLTYIGKKFLDRKEKTFYGDVFDLLIAEREIMSFDYIKKALIENKPQVNKGVDIFSNVNTKKQTKNFVKATHQKALVPAMHWSSFFKLKHFNKIIDIGGGSGIHTIAACINNHNLEGIVCDRSSVLTNTNEYLKEYNLCGRVQTQCIDMWCDTFPEGDVIFLGDIFHDWSPKKCLELAKKSYSSLKKGGIIMLHEMLFNDEKTGPSLSSAYNLKMMLWTEGQQFNTKELENILLEAGFVNINIKQSLGNWSLIIGCKQ